MRLTQVDFVARYNQGMEQGPEMADRANVRTAVAGPNQAIVLDGSRWLLGSCLEALLFNRRAFLAEKLASDSREVR